VEYRHFTARVSFFAIGKSTGWNRAFVCVCRIRAVARRDMQAEALRYGAVQT
jgi:hypothetical protein